MSKITIHFLYKIDGSEPFINMTSGFVTVIYIINFKNIIYFIVVILASVTNMLRIKTLANML